MHSLIRPLICIQRTYLKVKFAKLLYRKRHSVALYSGQSEWHTEKRGSTTSSAPPSVALSAAHCADDGQSASPGKILHDGLC